MKPFPHPISDCTVKIAGLIEAAVLYYHDDCIVTKKITLIDIYIVGVCSLSLNFRDSVPVLTFKKRVTIKIEIRVHRHMLLVNVIPVIL